MRYDVAIIGAGEAGVFAGYELMRKKPELSVLILEQGADIYSRRCPIVAGKVKSCIGCKPCAIMAGFGGAGALFPTENTTLPRSSAAGSRTIWTGRNSWT